MLPLILLLLEAPTPSQPSALLYLEGTSRAYPQSSTVADQNIGGWMMLIFHDSISAAHRYPSYIYVCLKIYIDNAVL